MVKRKKNFGIMSKILNSHKPAEVITFIPHENSSIIEELKTFTFNTGDNLLDNYVNIDWHDFSAISIYKRNNTIIGFSSVWHRPNYYKSKEVRILNRYYESNNMRQVSKIIGDSHLIEMVEQQLQIAKKLGFSEAFISREKTPRYFKTLITSIAEKTNTTWIIEPEKVCVCVPESLSCWQYKAWVKL